MRRIVCQFPNDTSFNDVLVHTFVCKNKVLKMYFEFVCYSSVCMLARDYNCNLDLKMRKHISIFIV